MTEDQFLSAHSQSWHQLENYCQQINKYGIKTLHTSDIKKFLSLFKLTSHHLAYAKTHYTGSSIITYLNNLVGQCNTYVYTSPKPNIAAFFSSILTDYNKLLKKYRLYILLSFGIFMIGALLSFILVYIKPETAYLFMDSSIVDSISQSGGSTSADSIASWNYPIMSSYIMVNNITIALKAFVYGITLGLGTIYILFSNGLILGSFTALFYLYGDPIEYWSLILPHGILELTACFIAGGAGLLIAKSFLIPGALNRKHSLIKGTKEALRLIGGVVVFLVIAALIEGFFTPLNIGIPAKLLFALLTAILLFIYIGAPYLKKKA